MAEHEPTKESPIICWASGICGKKLGKPALKGKYYEIRCGAKGHVCFFGMEIGITVNGQW